ncbi:hypothetical protein B4N89_24500 [Embleya scabrispora]|uniref:Uncharacterized protein n=1 Tax=Embleya scabrispora TaxID=159449 RepID=A0A1T3P451_9ACTN|nr:hypothetical protein B4N89_24500 [Embleya scabrispora]
MTGRPPSCGSPLPPPGATGSRGGNPIPRRRPVSGGMRIAGSVVPPGPRCVTRLPTRTGPGYPSKSSPALPGSRPAMCGWSCTARAPPPSRVRFASQENSCPPHPPGPSASTCGAGSTTGCTTSAPSPACGTTVTGGWSNTTTAPSPTRPPPRPPPRCTGPGP